ncbi:hypothetical protein STEG23_000696, partial [Scotinomys teguina]
MNIESHDQDDAWIGEVISRRLKKNHNVKCFNCGKKDCFCASRTRVESLRPEKQSETSVHQYLVDEPAVSWSPPSARAKEVTCSTNVSHYELQVEI